jgi:hypothetical protein
MSSFKLLAAFLGAWSFAATGFIAYDRWQHFAAEELARAAEQGRREVLGQVIREAAKCRPFNVVNGDQSAELVGASCLSRSAAGPESASRP